MSTPANARPEPRRTARREWVRALIEQGWARPDAPPPVARAHVVLMVAVVTAAGAIGLGIVLQLVQPVVLVAASAPAPPAPAQVETFTAVRGWDCTISGSAGFEVTGRTSAWTTVARGGWTEDGCHGTFEAIPMSGDRAKDDLGVSAVWWFTPGSGLTRCTVAVFRPRAEQAADSAATSAQYFVLDGRGGQRLASFVLDQTERPGSWASVGTFPVTANGIAVQLVNRGVAGIAGGRLAITQVRVECLL